MSKKWRLSWGLHRGTMMSRDNGDAYEGERKEDCIKRLEEIKSFLKMSNYKLYFASIYDPDENRVFHENGETY